MKCCLSVELIKWNMGKDLVLHEFGCSGETSIGCLQMITLYSCHLLCRDLTALCKHCIKYGAGRKALETLFVQTRGALRKLPGFSSPVQKQWEFDAQRCAGLEPK